MLNMCAHVAFLSSKCFLDSQHLLTQASVMPSRRHGHCRAGDTLRLLLDFRLLRLGRFILDLVSTSSWYIWYLGPDVLLSWQVLAKRPWFQMERLLETPQSVLESPKLNMTCDTATRVASYKTRQRQRQNLLGESMRAMRTHSVS